MSQSPVLSIIAPAHNEAENVAALVEQVGLAGPRAAAALAGGDRAGFEFILVDDGSTDDTRARAVALVGERPWLRVIAMNSTPAGSGNGQSAAFYAGFRAARGDFIATLDADLQNDPADLVLLAQRLVESGADMAQGDRTASRQDHRIRKIASAVGRAFRRGLLGDSIRDTGCSLRIMKRAVALEIPLQFKGVHRFIPVTARHLGYCVVELPVSHRARTAGVSKYGMGITKRAIPGLIDCLAMRWMRRRRRPTEAVELAAVEPTTREQAPAQQAAVRPSARQFAARDVSP